MRPICTLKMMTAYVGPILPVRIPCYFFGKSWISNYLSNLALQRYHPDPFSKKFRFFLISFYNTYNLKQHDQINIII
jgi:hypothetical protein